MRVFKDGQVKSSSGRIDDWKEIFNKFDYNNVFGIRSGDEPAGWRPFHRKMEGLLRPYRGETDANVEAKCAVLDNDVDPNLMEQGGDVEDVWMDDDECLIVWNICASYDDWIHANIQGRIRKGTRCLCDEIFGT